MKAVIIASAVGGVVLVAGAVALLPKDEAIELPPPAPAPRPEPVVEQPEEVFFEPVAEQNQGPGGPWGDMIRQYTNEFDADRDGRLNEEELRAALAAWEQRMLAQYDTNGDGVLSPEERRTAMEAMIRERTEAEMLRRYDADGDGTLSDAERAQIQADRAQREAQRQRWELQQFDLNGDGMVTDAERQEVQQKREAQRQEFMAMATSRFDSNGDGQLSRDEWREAGQQMREDMRDLNAARRVDQDGNGTADATDLAALAQKIAQGDMEADMNRDGVLDQNDLQWASDAVENIATRTSDPAWDAMLQSMGGQMRGMMVGGRGGPGGGPGGFVMQMDAGRGGQGQTFMTPEAAQLMRAFMGFSGDGAPVRVQRFDGGGGDVQIIVAPDGATGSAPARRGPGQRDGAPR